MSASPVPDTFHNNSTKEFSLSFGSHASGSQSESGISQRLDGTHNFATSSILSFDVLPATGVMADHKSQPPDAVLTAAAAMKATPQAPSKKGGKGAARSASMTDGGSPVIDQAPTPPAEPVKVKNQNVRRNVYISGVPPTYRSEDFRQLCQQFGRVEAAKLCVDNRNAPTKAYGFALYYSEESAASCIRGLNGSFLQGRCVQARLADSHATPQPLGDAGAAINTTLPPPSMQRDRRDNNNRSRRSGGSRRGSQGRRAVNNSSIPGAAVGNSGMPIQMPFNPMGMAGAMPSGGAMPMPMTQYFPFMAPAGGAVTATTALTTSAMDGHMAVNTSPSTTFFTVTPASCSPRTDCGFGAAGTPLPGSLTPGGSAINGAQRGGAPTAMSALSPASMALSPPLDSLHSSDSCSSLGSATAATRGNANGGPGDAMGNNANSQAVVSPFNFPFPNMAPMMPAGSAQMMVATAAVNGANGATSTEWAAPPAATAAFVYYPLPTGGYGAFPTTAATANGVSAYPGSPSPSGPPAATATANPVANGTVPFTYFPMGAVPMNSTATGMPALPPYLPSAPVNASNGGAEGVSGLPPSVVMMDNGMGLQLQMLR
ncbi:putative RNA-binding protein [Leishmania infantum JPCM5]|uniref:RNA-binding_protein_-_putative n=2 Tax=Leishmania infantum TaxID=5671 RepID=A0A6L0XPP0_LEIIN|nr:putative RNA-binding protein [Leishmania infantum JPCM5]CAC9489507.1 RNA-binding_protein_-_putative [Leishmania infantum]CAM68192.1 putative RNA-binding protein [Leishmania infantum JPCM5]SUZ41963.1 RNA-binding_protein_-_putative [Leishmania infantum]|eukprot:XP_001465765.1 putative RNA-binding protein [Leishmania infantum JPCM5]